MEATTTAGEARPDAMLATSAQRIFAWIVDATVLAVALTPLNPFLYAAKPPWVLFQALWATSMLIMFIVLLLFDGGQRGATLGKRVLGIRVIGQEGSERIGYRRAAIRRLAFFAGGFAFAIGWLLLLNDPSRQAWHDRLAHTLVVTVR